MSTQIPAWCTRAAEEIAARSLTDNQDGRHSAAIIAKHAPARNESRWAELLEIVEQTQPGMSTLPYHWKELIVRKCKAALHDAPAPSLEREAIEALREIVAAANAEIIVADPHKRSQAQAIIARASAVLAKA